MADVMCIGKKQVVMVGEECQIVDAMRTRQCVKKSSEYASLRLFILE
jgi:hypothetical protein